MKTSYLVFAALLAVTGYGFYRYGVSQQVAQVQAQPAVKKPLYWHDPMNPAQHFDKPGKSPYMDMELEPVYADDADAVGTQHQVSIKSGIRQNLGIRTAAVTQGRLASDLTAVGSVAYNERDVAVVQSRSNGYVEHVSVRTQFEPVRKGQKLAELTVPDWVAAQEEYLTVLHMQGVAGLDGLLDGARQRMRLAGMSEGQIAQVSASGKVHTQIALTAPIDGVVSELAIREGMTVNAGAALYTINALKSVWVMAELPENQAAQVRPGTLVEALAPALSGVLFKGRVQAILPEVNPATRTIKARIELANPGGKLVPGMFATVHFLSAPTAREVLLVPSEAVIRTGTRNVVMVEQGEGRFSAADIETGSEAHGLTEVRKGLQAGQKVVVSGQFLIDSEASLKASTERMEDAPADQGEQK